jgi:hypothetical protein
MKVSCHDSKWYSTEVISDLSFGYGTYVFYLGSRGDTLDKEITLGLFTWDDNQDAGQINQYREIDFEFSRWEDPNNNDFQFVVQPYNYTAANIYRFNINNNVDINTVNYFTWSANSIKFTSAYGSIYPANPSDIINTWTHYGPCDCSFPDYSLIHSRLI